MTRRQKRSLKTLYVYMTHSSYVQYYSNVQEVSRPVLSIPILVRHHLHNDFCLIVDLRILEDLYWIDLDEDVGVLSPWCRSDWCILQREKGSRCMGRPRWSVRYLYSKIWLRYDAILFTAKLWLISGHDRAIRNNPSAPLLLLDNILSHLYFHHGYTNQYTALT